MKTFIQRFGNNILGVLHGFDRIRFRGTRRFLANVAGMMGYLWHRQVLLKDFKAFAGKITDEVRQAAEASATSEGRPIEYLHNSEMKKEDWARQVAKRDGLQQGLIGVLKAVECCWSYEVGPNRAAKKLELRGKPSKCLHYYHYFMDPEVGLAYVRLQTWFPFTVHVGMNGREWLARHLDKIGLRYQRRDNCFAWIEDWAAAQRLLDEQLRTDWPGLLNRLLQQANPALSVVDTHPTPYYWSMDEGEWASDLAFRSPKALAELAPRLFRHAWLNFDSGDVMRFLGRKTTAEGPHGNFDGEVVTDLKRRAEGTRIKHRLNANWIKMYDKQGSVLRVETVINHTRDMKVYRTKEGDEDGEKSWQRLRKGVADIQRRTEISQAANERYVEALATVDDSRSLAELTEAVCEPVKWQGKRARGLNPLAKEDARLLEAVNRGEFVINGFRNRDLRKLLFTRPAKHESEQRQQSSAITRKLRLLRAHGLIHKVPKTHRYQLSPHGRDVINALLTARQASTAKLAA
ncbi:MAG TPA: hypothetical protein VG099_11860 [Gemmataceae bacterium]|jgi:hypothetical protein|nr:hypothetical protein [Gemmataceae bacterium]